MPEKLERCVKHLMGKGKSKSSAYAICTAAMKRKKKGGGRRKKRA